MSDSFFYFYFYFEDFKDFKDFEDFNKWLILYVLLFFNANWFKRIIKINLIY
jgi:hypothetical protein